MSSIARGDMRVAGVCVRASWCMAWVLLLAAQPALAQSRGINGVVRDPQQAVVAGAEVVLINSRTAVRATALTDGLGRYSFAPPAPDTYVVEVHAKGFKVVTSEAIALAAGESVTQDFVLALAGTNESVTVTGIGDVEQGYRVDTVSSLGSSGPALLLDTPYTVSVLPSELIDNAQVKSFKEATKFLPLMEFQEMQGSEIMRPADARVAGQQHAEHPHGRHGHRRHRRQQPGNGAADRSAQRPGWRDVRPGESVGHVQLRAEATDRAAADVNWRSATTITPSARSTPTSAAVSAAVGRFGYRANLLAGDGETFVQGQSARPPPGQPRGRRAPLRAHGD